MAQLQNLHALPIVLSAVAAWFFGAVYYGILGPKWMAAQGKTIEQCKAENAGKSTAAKITPFVLSFIAELVMASALSGIIRPSNSAYARPRIACSATARGRSCSATASGLGSNERLEQLFRRITVGAVDGSRPRLEIRRISC